MLSVIMPIVVAPSLDAYLSFGLKSAHLKRQKHLKDFYYKSFYGRN
jgi:hypothetical protein